MKHVLGHFDGEKVVLDEPLSIPTDTLVVPDSREEADRLSADLYLTSIPSLKKIWDNPDDARYDAP